MTEELDVIVYSSEWQPPTRRQGINPTASTVSLMRSINLPVSAAAKILMSRDKYTPYSDKLDLNVN